MSFARVVINFAEAAIIESRLFVDLEGKEGKGLETTTREDTGLCPLIKSVPKPLVVVGVTDLLLLKYLHSIGL